ncbi:MAG: sugar kinase, partial [Lentisphaerae bacterium]|nr:sugar kinase [Lentisphaerota bacterium]
PVDGLLDPTGAGDMFAGAFMGALAAEGGVTDRAVRRALLCGAAVASIGVEAFSLEALTGLTREAIDGRLLELKEMTAV